MRLFCHARNARSLVAASVVAAVVTGALTGMSSSAVAAGDHSGRQAYVRPSTAARWRSGATSGRPTTRRHRTAPRLRVLGSGEIPSMRTAASRTYRARKGGYRTVFTNGVTAYRTRTGAYRPLPRQLTRRPNGALSDDQGTFSATLPATSTGTMTTSDSGAGVDVQLTADASVAARSSNTSASYTNAYTDTDVTYTVGAQNVDETLTLHGTDAPASFPARVTVDSGSTLRLNADNSILVIGGDGSVQATLPPPWMQDASGDTDQGTSTDIKLAISGSSPNYVVTMTPLASWLDDPARVFPVTIDPSVTFIGGTGEMGCYYTNTSTSVGSTYETTASDTGICSVPGGTDSNLRYGQIGHARRSFLIFPDVTDPSSPIPADAIVTDANLAVTERTSLDSSSFTTDLYRVNQAWGSGTTWATMPPNVSTLQDQVTMSPPGAGQQITFKVANLVQQWVLGHVPNHGLVIEDDNEQTINNGMTLYGFANAANRPALTVYWRPEVGQQQWIPTYDHQLTDRMTLHVDLPDRNLVLTNTDENMSGPGQNLTIVRTYNSRNAASSVNVAGAWGPGWSMNNCADVTLNINRAYATLTDRTGALGDFRRHFEQAAENVTQHEQPKNPSWIASGGLNADLVKDDSTHYRVIFHRTKVQWTFTLPSTVPAVGWLSKINDGAGNNIVCNWDSYSQRVSSVTDTTGQRSVNFAYKGNGYIYNMNESLAAGATGARSWTYGYSDGTHLTSYTDPAGNVTDYCYTSGLLTKIITPHGVALGEDCTTTQGTDVTDIVYDSDGKVTSISYENGTNPAITVNFAGASPPPGGSGSQTTETDPYGYTTTYHYDTTDRATQTDSPMGYHLSAQYNSNNDVTAVVSPNNFTGSSNDPATTFAYDEGVTQTLTMPYNLTSITSPEGVTQHFTYNDANNPYLADSSTNDQGITTSYSRNNNGQITSATTGQATVDVRHQGDSGVNNCGPGGAAAYTGATCETRDGGYNANTPAEHRTLYSYDGLGRMVSMTPPQPNHGRPTPPAWTFSYDSHSRLASKTDAEGNTTSYSYDALDRLTQITYQDGSSTKYSYDEDGDLLSAKDYTSAGAYINGTSDTRSYDALDRLVSDTQAGYAATTQTWDADSRLLTVNDGSAGDVTYGYNPDGSLTSMTDAGGSCTGYSLNNLPPASAKCILFDVDKDGNRLRTVFPGDNSEQRISYDNDGKISSLANVGTSGGAGTTFENYDLNYGNGSTPTAHLYQRANGGTPTDRMQYSYSPAGRLAEVDKYDATSGGNQTGSWIYCYGNANNLAGTSGCPTSQYSYDGANETLGTGHSYGLDGEEQSNLSSLPNPGSTRTSTWTVSQQLATVQINSGAVLHNTYAGSTNDRLLTSDTSGTGQDQLRYDPRGISEITHTESGTQAYRYHIERDPSGVPIAFRNNSGALYYVLTDQQDSILHLVNSSGAAVDSYHYTPYGTRITDAETVTQPLGYLGGYTNTGMGLIHFGARWYDPDNGVFTQVDPKPNNTDPLADNQYRYASNDPINNSDVTGQFSVGEGLILGGAGLAAAGGILTAGLGGLAFLAGASDLGSTIGIGGMIGGAVTSLAGAITSIF